MSGVLGDASGGKAEHHRTLKLYMYILFAEYHLCLNSFECHKISVAHFYLYILLKRLYIVFFYLGEWGVYRSGVGIIAGLKIRLHTLYFAGPRVCLTDYSACHMKHPPGRDDHVPPPPPQPQRPLRPRRAGPGPPSASFSVRQGSRLSGGLLPPLLSIYQSFPAPPLPGPIFRQIHTTLC